MVVIWYAIRRGEPIILRDVCLRYRLDCCKRLSPGCGRWLPCITVACEPIFGVLRLTRVLVRPLQVQQ
jgi:hypothetical protein